MLTPPFPYSCFNANAEGKIDIYINHRFRSPFPIFRESVTNHGVLECRKKARRITEELSPWELGKPLCSFAAEIARMYITFVGLFGLETITESICARIGPSSSCIVNTRTAICCEICERKYGFLGRAFGPLNFCNCYLGDDLFRMVWYFINLKVLYY